MKKANVAVRPDESLFYGPLLYALLKTTGGKPYIGVDHLTIRDDVIRLAGIDPENCPWPLEDSSSEASDGLYQIVSLAWYRQTREYGEKEALCCRPLDPESKGKEGFWALTDLGVKRAKALKPVYEGKIVFSSGPNDTAKFLGDNWDRIHASATRALKRKMPRSQELGKIDDHIMNWVERIVQRDGLRNRIHDGRPLAPSQIAGWMRRAAYTEIRNEGREPVCRVFHGALTPKEYRGNEDDNWTEQVIPRTINESEFLVSTQYGEHSENDDWAQTDIGDKIQDRHDFAQVEGSIADCEAFELCLDQIASVLQSEIDPKLDLEFHMQLIHERFVQGMTVREIAEEHGLCFDKHGSRIRSALNRVRTVMKRARTRGKFDEFLTY